MTHRRQRATRQAWRGTTTSTASGKPARSCCCEDGRFQWYFTYGALDLAAEGRWQREGANVVLMPDAFHAPPQYPETEFKRMQLRIDGKDLVPAWPWEERAERGRYVLE